MKYDTAPVMPFLQPQGRLTLTSGAPANNLAVVASANVFYSPYAGNLVPIWDGTQFKPQIFAELTNVLANSATGNAGPAAGAAAKNYDLFLWQSGSSNFLTRGGAWFSDTARSTATENDLQRVNGVFCNLNAITNGPAAGYGTYLGTVRTDAGGATVSLIFGAVGTAGKLGVWNNYNRLDVGTSAGENTATWNYNGVIRKMNNTDLTRVDVIRGLNEDNVYAHAWMLVTLAAITSTFLIVQVGVAGAVATMEGRGQASNNGLAVVGTQVGMGHAFYNGLIGLGWQNVIGMEQGDTVNNYATVANSLTTQGVAFRGKM